MFSKHNKEIVEFVNDIKAIDDIISPGQEIANFINSIKALDSIGSSKGNGVYVQLFRSGKTTLLHLYAIDDRLKLLKNDWSEYNKRLPEVNDELFRSEFFNRLGEANISYSLEEGYLPGISVFRIWGPEVKIEHIEQILTEIDSDYYKPVY